MENLILLKSTLQVQYYNITKNWTLAFDVKDTLTVNYSKLISVNLFQKQQKRWSPVFRQTKQAP